MTNSFFSFVQRRKLTPYKNPKARLVSAPLKQSNSSDLVSYRFVVRTGTKKNCGTRAQVNKKTSN